MYNNNLHKNGKKRHERLVPFVFLTLILVFFYRPASAHKVTIFAWIEGDTVHTQSKFSKGKRVKGAPVTVFDSFGNQILEGKTDEKGLFSFKVPQKEDLKVVLHASMGHRAEWTIPAEEIMVATANQTGISETDEKADTQESLVATNVRPIKESPGATTAGRQKIEIEEMEEMIEAALDKKLAPIIHMLANAQNREPGITDIIGGIGYIFGLVGMALYFANRKKKE
jgi:nickel transport protein